MISFLKKYFIVLFISSIFINKNSTAQPSPILNNTADGMIKGRVTDAKTKTPIDFATVSLTDLKTNKPVKSAQTDLDGNFSLPNLTDGVYSLKISFVGYVSLVKDSLNISETNRSYNLGNLTMLAGKSSVLQEVTVTAQKNSLQLGIDKKVFSVDQSVVSQGGSASDLLTNIPSVQVDIDGNVSLRGTNNVRILIDGKPSAIAGNITQVLQSLPASSIETVELITNPSSKYDAEGQSGIINIVLKKNKKLGLNGSLALSAGNRDNYNANTSLSYQNDKWNFFGNYSYRRGNRFGSGFNNTDYFTVNQLINNSSSSRRSDNGNTLKAGIEHSFSKQTSLGISANVNLRTDNGFEDLNYLYQNIPNLNGRSNRISDRSGDDNGYDLSLDFTHRFKRKGEELVANATFGQAVEDESQTFNQSFFTPDGTLRDTLDRRINDNGEYRDNLNLQLDYTLPFSKTQKVEAGYRTSIRNEDSNQDSRRLNTDLGVFVDDYALSNDFILEDIVHAVYGNYQNQLTKNFGFQTGLRAEQAYLNTRYTGIDPVSFENTAADGRLDYFRLYPSIFLTQKLKSGQQLQLSYTRRVNRPRGWQVNPFRDVSDPNNIRIGNPNLRPEDIHSFEFNYARFFKKVTLTTSVYYRQVNDVVQGIRLQATDENAATITQFFNLSKSKATGFEVISKVDFSSKFNTTGNVNVFYNTLEGNEQFNLRSSDGVNWSANLTSNLQLPKSIFAQVQANYNGPRVTSQGRSVEVFVMDVGLRKDLLKSKAASLSLNVRDVFNTRKFGSSTETDFFNQDFQRRMLGRMANLTLSYRFGKQTFNSKRRQNEQRDEQPQEGNF